MRIVQHGNVYKIQEQKFNLCSREPYWKTLKYKINSEAGENEFEYEFNYMKEAEEFISKNFLNHESEDVSRF